LEARAASRAAPVQSLTFLNQQRRSRLVQLRIEQDRVVAIGGERRGINEKARSQNL
jgi:hypothetical protein